MLYLSVIFLEIAFLTQPELWEVLLARRDRTRLDHSVRAGDSESRQTLTLA